MKFKFHADLDLVQQCLLVVIISIIISYILSFIVLTQFMWCQLLLSVGIGVAILQSSLQLDTEGKSVLITGCDTGFGLVLAKHLHSLGFTVFAGCRNGAGAEELDENASKRMHVITLDVTNPEDWEKVKQYIEKNLPINAKGLWGLVNNAGCATFGDVEWVPVEDYKKIMDVNLYGVILGIKSMLPLIRRCKGRIVTSASTLGRFAVTSRSPYSTSKYALEGFLDCLRYEMKHFGVSVSILEPGNYTAATNIFDSMKIHADELWENMNDEVKAAYGRKLFNKRVEALDVYFRNGSTDITPVIESYTRALLDVFPQVRYQPMNLLSKIQCFVATHFPESFYQMIYV